ncbi:hypothetical protein Pcinc_006800 [Petrolisthes cinctipes]|uniref:Uncharacterized protein n=1 Tax=Petrolisthes cinctipes TaxID=88211 RepID=A0AAE1GAR1_PETCI|nr:hypothetical protein Pcinc_006800 [Petrolisthes cinctipes]
MHTHANFKSLVEGVTSAEAIWDRVGCALECERQFVHKTSPWEADLWEENALDRFTINLESIDRLYYINHENGVCDDNYELLARVEQKGRHLFVELIGGWFSDSKLTGGGEIFVGFNANLFLTTISTKVPNEQLLYKSLTEDGHLKEGDIVMGRWHKDSPMLKFLCHEAVYRNRHRLVFYREVATRCTLALLEAKDGEEEGEVCLT